MEDFIELGIEGVDKLVDKQFHHVPDAALHSSTYHPRNVKKLNPRKLRHRDERRRGGPSSETSSISSETELGGQQDNYHHHKYRTSSGDDRHTYTHDKDVPLNAGPYPQTHTTVAPRSRSQYRSSVENQFPPPRYHSPPPMDSYYYPPQVSVRGRRERGRDYDDDYYSDAAPRARPKPVSRRSNSVSHTIPRSNLALTERRLKQHQKRLRSQEAERDRQSSTGNGNDIAKHFTATDAGLGAGVIGAVVGGWATQKAQVVVGADKMASSRRRNSGNALVTALGAAAAGLAANVLVDRWEDNKKKNKESDRKWEEKFGNGGAEGWAAGEDRSRGRGRDYRHDQHTRRRRSSGHYVGERHDRGYESWDDGYDR